MDWVLLIIHWLSLFGLWKIRYRTGYIQCDIEWHKKMMAYRESVMEFLQREQRVPDYFEIQNMMDGHFLTPEELETLQKLETGNDHP